MDGDCYFDEMFTLQAEFLDDVTYGSPGIINVNEMFTESADMKKESVLKRIWKFILRCVKRIAAYIKKFIRWVKSVFTGKKKSVEQILIDDVGVKARGIQEADIDPDAVLKPMLIKFREDGSLELDVNKNIKKYARILASSSYLMGEQAQLNISYRGRGMSLKGNAIISKDRIVTLMTAFTNQEIKDALEESLTLLAKTEDLNDIPTGKIAKLINSMTSDGKSVGDDDKIIITYKQLDDYQRWIDKIANISDAVDDRLMNNDFNDADYWIRRLLNSVSQISLTMQYALNMLTSLITDMYKIDASYCKTISTPEKMALFASKCIENRFPQKFTIKAIYDVSTKELSGRKKVRNDTNKVPHGAGRVVLIPDGNKKEIYKVATNIDGIRSNKNENKISRMFEDKIPIAQVHKEYNDCTLIAMTRAKTKMTIGLGDLMHFKDDLKSKFKQLGKSYTVGDIGAQNLGYIDGKLVLIDYASILHMSHIGA